jgi:hypothetical protein
MTVMFLWRLRYSVKAEDHDVMSHRSLPSEYTYLIRAVSVTQCPNRHTSSAHPHGVLGGALEFCITRLVFSRVLQLGLN